ncbi:arsenate reductase (glutaredoxin) [Arenicella xantha]|uniref:Arsenate reductase n=1 Tax=Arenicella xantha TaxID=644221 RepID=A0A395JPQ4_9GAMM|nr:arsenate reductase (glutaredoxin) [Arenicella xantha]RBP51548.1 arsenate reductase [Arenicella xantha]
MEITIYHNPRCSKSRQTLQLLQERGIEPRIVEYLTNPPTHQELDSILRGLEFEPRQLMRKKEEPYLVMGLDNPALERDQLIDAMLQAPKLIERPIVVVGDEVAIGRPPEAVLTILP